MAPLLPKLRGHFAEFLNQSSLKRLGLLTPPTCVGFRYGLQYLSLRGFSWQLGLSGFAIRLGITPQGPGLPDLPKKPPYTLAPGIPPPGPPTLLRPPFTQTRYHRYGNINPFPISYAFRPRLRGRLTLGRLSLPRKPWVYGEQVFHLFSRYSCQHSHFSAVHSTSRCSFTPQRTLSYQLDYSNSEASAPCLAPFHFRRRAARPVSYYAFFKGWLLLSQPPGCLCGPTSFPTEHELGDLSCRSGLFPSRPRTLSPAV